MWIIMLHDGEAIDIYVTVLEMHLKICTSHHKPLAFLLSSLLFLLPHKIIEK